VKQFVISPEDVDAEHGRLSMAGVFKLLGDAAEAEAQTRGLSLEALLKVNLGWMLRSARVELEAEPPRAGELLSIETWPSGRRGLFAETDFLLYDGGGQRIGAATSTWLAVDLLKRRPARLPQQVLSIAIPDRPRVFSPGPGTGTAGFELEPAASAPQVEVIVGLDDLDHNFHLNHLRYIEWSLAPVSSEQRASSRLVSIDVLFRAEAFFGDAITASSDADGAELRHRLVRDEDGVELSRAVSRWILREGRRP
jgi:acyl-ACP thioesterase